LACLTYGLSQRKGFIAMIGEVGVGKTMILRSYLAKVDPSKQKSIYLVNPHVTFDELLCTVLKELGVEPHAGPVTDKVGQLHDVLIGEYRNQRTVVLIIDEAHNLPIETLESIRMLSNLETSTEKLIQIVLVGQPELEGLLSRHELRQVRERIVLRARIAPFSKDQSAAYIQHRLRTVSREPRAVFSQPALDLIVQTAGGIPRRLNILCDNALITGFSYQEPVISKKTAKEVIRDVDGHAVTAIYKIQPRHAVMMLSVAVPILFYVIYATDPAGVPSVSSPDINPSHSSTSIGSESTPPEGGTDLRSPIAAPPMAESEAKATGPGLPPADWMELVETARLLAVLLDCGRVVVGRAQPAINNPRLEDKNFSSAVFDAHLRKEFQARTRHDLHNLASAKMPERAKPLLVRLAFFMQKGVHDVQPDINKKGIGFKGFIPATFATQAAERFSKDTGLQLRQIGPPGKPPRNPNNKPDEQDEQLLFAIQNNHPRVGDHIVENRVAGDGGVRVLLPLFYNKQCLHCHGAPKGEVDISGYEKEGFKDGDLGGAISITVPLQHKIAKGMGE
jgi:type II secretory pathway predicted ATPase ExeA